jgi:hypothetical protein
VTPLIEAGRVYLPRSADWLVDFLDELSSFPAAPHDDMVDAFSQALNHVRAPEGGDWSVEYGNPIQILFGANTLADEFGVSDLRDPYLDEHGNLRPEAAAEKARRLGECESNPSTAERDRSVVNGAVDLIRS